MPIHLLKEKATSAQVQEMLADHAPMIKIAVDIRRKLLAGGGKMHADCESVLLAEGSAQDDVWGANWYPSDQSIEFESLINIRPRLGNRSIMLQNATLTQPLEAITRELLGGVQ